MRLGTIPINIYRQGSCLNSTIQYNTIQYNTIQYNTIQYNTIQYNTMLPSPHPRSLPPPPLPHLKILIINIYKVSERKDLKIAYSARVPSSTGERGEAPPKRLSFPTKSFPEKTLKLFQIKIFFDDDFKESVKVTNVQKCDFSQS